MKLSDTIVFDAIRVLLDRIPRVRIQSVRYAQETLNQYGIDGVVTLTHGGVSTSLVVQVNSNGAPRYVRAGIFQLESYVTHMRSELKGKAEMQIVPLIMSQYLSPQSREICVAHGVAYLDLLGNARLVFDPVFIERSVPERPATEKRALRSLFSPKAATILRLLLREPNRAWRVTELAREAHASYGHVSNVRKALLEREWLGVRSDGVVLVNPSALMQEWRSRYRQPDCESISGYTTFQDNELSERLRDKLNPSPESPQAIYAMHSAAQCLAPVGRRTSHTFYVDDRGAELLYAALALTRNVEGPNVTLCVLKDKNLFLDAFEPAPTIFCTSPVVTYLDLCAGSDHDREAGERLEQKYFTWQN